MLTRAGFAPTLDVAPAAIQTPKRSGGKAEADLWHEATRGPEAVSTPTTR